jgi:TonB-dependent starch-binding outer membrane protein SusC
MKQGYFLKKISALITLMLMGIFVYAQEITVSGTVTDDRDGSPLVGVTVIQKGTLIGTSTDFDGKYSISVQPNSTLIFSYVGYTSIEMPVNSRTTINIVMNEVLAELDEVIVVGYGTQRKRDVTGAIAKVENKDLTSIPTPSFELGLQGKALGVQVITGSGMAGSGSVIRIRGVGSISAGGDPLYVVDGVAITQDYFIRGNSGAMNNNPLATINPSDIQSVEILKDAGSAGIYGSRGANGVILITTKRGQNNQKSRINFSSRMGVSRPAYVPKFVSRDEYLQLRQEAWENDGGTGAVWLPNFSTSDQSPEDRLAALERAKTINTNWWDLVTETGFKQDYNLSYSHGGKWFNTYIGGSYSENASYLKNNKYERYNGRINIDSKFSEIVNFNFSTSYSNGINHRVGAAWEGGTGAAMSTALPYYPVKNEDGTFFRYNSSANGNNPLLKQELLQWRNYENRSINNLSINYKPISDLVITATGGLDYMDIREEMYEPREYIESDHLGYAKMWPSYITNKTGSVTANYELKINENNRITFLAGSEAQSSIRRSFYQDARDVDGPYWSDFSKGGTLDNDGNSLYQEVRNRFTPQEWTFVSFFSRVNYVLNDKYIFQVLARSDGSSRFGKNNRFGFFPAASAAWRISEEDFLKGNSIISNLRLRLSYGVTGNANLPNYAWLGTYSPPENNIPGYNGYPITYPSNLENPNLQWESLYNFDAGLEFGFLSNRITGELSFYNKVTTNVIIQRTNAPSTGFSNYWDNIAEILNRGVEFSLRSNNLTGPFTWVTEFNIASNHNEVLSIGDLTPDAVGGGTNDTRIVVGKPVGANYLVRYVGVDPADGLPIWLDKEGSETKTFSLDNRVVVGSVIPDAIGAMTNSFSYKNFDFSFMFVFTIGGNIYDNSGKRQLGVVTDWNLRKEITDRWREPGDIASFPKLTLTPSNYPGLPGEWQYNSTMFLYDASYLRLRNVSFGYSLPKSTAARLKVSNARFYFTASNLLTLTKFKGDPEIARDFENIADRNMSSNITYLTPPQEQSFTFGIELSF